MMLPRLTSVVNDPLAGVPTSNIEVTSVRPRSGAVCATTDRWFPYVLRGYVLVTRIAEVAADDPRGMDRRTAWLNAQHEARILGHAHIAVSYLAGGEASIDREGDRTRNHYCLAVRRDADPSEDGPSDDPDSGTEAAIEARNDLWASRQDPRGN